MNFKKRADNKRRRNIYQALRRCGLSSYMARAMRTWSDHHIRVYLGNCTERER